MTDDIERDITRVLDTCAAVRKRAEKRGWLQISDDVIVSIALAVERRHFERALIESIPDMVKDVIQ